MHCSNALALHSGSACVCILLLPERIISYLYVLETLLVLAFCVGQMFHQAITTCLSVYRPRAGILLEVRRRRYWYFQQSTERSVSAWLVVVIPFQKVVSQYTTGIQREQFLSFLSILEARCPILELKSPVDWRRQKRSALALAHAETNASWFLQSDREAFDAAVKEQIGGRQGLYCDPKSICI